MTIFGVSVKPGAEAVLFFDEVNKRLGTGDMIKNPFNGRARLFGPGFYVVDMAPIFPNLTWIGWIPAIIALLAGSILWAIPGLVLVACGAFWGADFFYLMLKMGLRKAGYKGPIRLFRTHKTLRRVLDQWDR